VAEAGLLDDQDATTHWAYCDALARRFPTVRVHAHRSLVVSGDAPIDEVAEQVGYADPSFFRRLFGRRVGLTPSQYRRRFRAMRLQLL
jgi:transcriptional regulator GlxA family with amidase domain